MGDRERINIYFVTEKDQELASWIREQAEINGRSMSGQALFMLRQARKIEEAAQRARREAMSEIDWEVA